MFQRNSLKASFFLYLKLIILTQCGSLENPGIFQDNYKVEHEDIMAKITSDQKVSIYQKDSAEWILTQEIETDAEIRGVFLTGEFLVIEEEGYCLSLYEGRKMNSLETGYQWKAMIQLNREQKVEAVEVKEQSLAVRFEQTTDLYDFSVKAWANERNERILQASAPTFQPFVLLSNETESVYGIRLVGDYLLYSGRGSQMKLAKYDGSAFQQLLVTDTTSNAYAVGLDATKKWLFQGQELKVNVYADEGSGYQLKQVLDTNIRWAMFMDVYSDYFLISDTIRFQVYKWDGSQFNLEQNFTQPNQGVKMCSDNTILVASVSGAGLRVYNSTYQLSQEILVEQAGEQYSLSATEDCQTVILSPVQEFEPKKIYDFRKNSTGQYVMFKNYSQARDFYIRRSCIHPDGDFFIQTGSGSDVWLRNQDTGEYVFQQTLDKGQVACDINRELIILTDLSGEVYSSVYNPLTRTS